MKEELKRREYCKTDFFNEKSLIAFCSMPGILLFFFFSGVLHENWQKKDVEDCVEGRL